MKLAVVQHARRDSASEDLAALVAAVSAARTQGAEVVVLPRLEWLSQPEVRAVLDAGSSTSDLPAVAVLGASPLASTGAEAQVATGIELAHTPLGATVTLTGDECLDPLVARELALAEPDAIILRPGSESELQAEAILERALGLSESVSGLVVVAEFDGGRDGEAGHGGSAVVVLGEVVAEAQRGDDVLFSDVRVPVDQPDSRMPVPELPPILAQRLAHHHGERAPVDYPAELT